mgnify:CR=1 FL=1
MNEKKREILETKQLETFTKFLKRVILAYSFLDYLRIALYLSSEAPEKSVIKIKLIT